MSAGDTRGKEAANEGLAAYVGIRAPETPRYLLANNFLLEYFMPSKDVDLKYNFSFFLDRMKTLTLEEGLDRKERARLENAFNRFFDRYLGREVIREGNSRIGENKHYYFPITQDLLARSSQNLRHMLFYLQSLDEKFDFKRMQDQLEDYIFRDDTGLNHIIKILLQDEGQIRRQTNVEKGACASFWDMLADQERGGMEKLARRLNEDLDALLTHRYFRKLDFYRRYNYLAVLLTSYVIQFIVCRKGEKACMLCQGAPRDMRLDGGFHKASCSNYAYIRTLFPNLLTRYYTDMIRKNLPEAETLRMEARDGRVLVEGTEFNKFAGTNLKGDNREREEGRSKGEIEAAAIMQAFALKEGEARTYAVDHFVMRYIKLTGTRRGSTLTKISSTLPTSGRQIDMVFPQNRSSAKYFAMSETLAEFYVRLYLARKDMQYEYLDNFIRDLEERYRIVLVKSSRGEKMLKEMKISLSTQEYARNKVVLIELLGRINCLIKLSDSGYVVTLPEEKGDFKLI